MTVPKFFQGTIRPKIKPLGIDLATGFAEIEIEWIEMQTNRRVFLETIKIPPKNAAFSQIQCTGLSKPVDGIFVDEHGKRHFVLRAEPGELGLPFA